MAENNSFKQCAKNEGNRQRVIGFQANLPEIGGVCGSIMGTKSIKLHEMRVKTLQEHNKGAILKDMVC